MERGVAGRFRLGEMVGAGLAGALGAGERERNREPEGLSGERENIEREYCGETGRDK
jgi:hypothetical protein